jgi:hypothetical protein
MGIHPDRFVPEKQTDSIENKYLDMSSHGSFFSIRENPFSPRHPREIIFSIRNHQRPTPSIVIQ